MCPEFKRKSDVDEDFVYEVMCTPGVVVKSVLSKQKRPMGPS